MRGRVREVRTERQWWRVVPLTISRPVVVAGVVLFAIGVERLMNAWLLRGAQAAHNRAAIGVAFAAAAAFILIAAAVMSAHAALDRRFGDGSRERDDRRRGLETK